MSCLALVMCIFPVEAVALTDRFVVGMSVPISVESPGRSLGFSVNFQGLYRLPDNITYFEPYKVLHKRSLANTLNRNLIYNMLENEFKKWEILGSDCLPWLICTTAQSELQSTRQASGSGDALDDDYALPPKLAQILFTFSDATRVRRQLVFPKGSKFFIRINTRENLLNYTTIFVHTAGFKMSWDLPDLLHKNKHIVKRDLRNGLDDLMTHYALNGTALLENIYANLHEGLSSYNYNVWLHIFMPWIFS